MSIAQKMGQSEVEEFLRKRETLTKSGEVTRNSLRRNGKAANDGSPSAAAGGNGSKKKKGRKKNESKTNPGMLSQEASSQSAIQSAFGRGALSTRRSPRQSRVEQALSPTSRQEEIVQEDFLLQQQRNRRKSEGHQPQHVHLSGPIRPDTSRPSAAAHLATALGSLTGIQCDCVEVWQRL
eukprot:SAG31_NODE_1305_length_8893_cov_7.391176_5_plen_180_part_00